MIGKLLLERYQIVQVLSAGAFGQTYIAEDIHHPLPERKSNTQALAQGTGEWRVVKHIKPASSDSRCFRTTKRQFATETNALKKLGHHEQIPQLYASFEENREFYLVQQFIQGHPLSAELPISNGCVKRWTEDQVVRLLQEVLCILKFVHNQGFIHCDLKPNNLIRSASDGKLFLIDFGAVQPIPRAKQSDELKESTSDYSSLNQHSPSGYIPIEQLKGYPRPNSDLYALGSIAIQALTGLDPAQLKVDPHNGEVIWQHQVQVSDVLTRFLNQMVCYDFNDRYESAELALQALEQQVLGADLTKISVEMPEMVTLDFQFFTSPISNLRLLLSFFLPKPSPVLTGMGVCIAANTLVIGLGIYSLLHAFTLEPEPNVLATAQERYQAGDLYKAIALAKSVPSNSASYAEARAAIEEWRRDWNLAELRVKAAEKAFNEGRWLDVLEEADKLPTISFWKQKIEPFVRQAKPQIDAEAQQLLQKGYDKAAAGDFTSALYYLKQIPPETPVSEKVQQKLIEYKQKQRIKANYLLQQAFDRASARDFLGAIRLLQQIPEETPAYAKAKAKLARYAEQQRRLEKAESDRSLTTAPRPQSKESSLNPGSQLLEITLTGSKR